MDACECSVSFFNGIIDPRIRSSDIVPPNFPDVFSDVQTHLDIFQLSSDFFELSSVIRGFRNLRSPTM